MPIAADKKKKKKTIARTKHRIAFQGVIRGIRGGNELDEMARMDACPPRFFHFLSLFFNAFNRQFRRNETRVVTSRRIKTRMLDLI